MALAFQLLKTIVTKGASQALFDIPERLLLSDDTGKSEADAVKFAKHHFGQYAELPSTDLLVQNGFPIPIRASDNIKFYIDEMANRAQYNAVIAPYAELGTAIKDRKMTDARNAALKVIQEFDNFSTERAFSTMGEEVQGVYDEYNQYRWTTESLRGITSGWPTCDRLTLGFQPGDLVVIVGRPGMGKSYLLQESAFQANLMGRSSMIMSMEMTKRQLAQRWVARKAGLNPTYIRNGQLSMWGEAKLEAAVREIQRNHAPVYLEAGDMDKSIDGVEEMFRKHTPDIIYLDSAYLFSPSGRKQGFISRWEAITSVINDLKKLALRLNRAIVITVQFNRNVKSSGFKEMDMSDIGDSDAIPRNASIILGVRKHQPPYMDIRRVIQIMKNRDGGAQNFATNFSFAPVNFEECLLEEVDGMDDTTRDNRPGRGSLDLSHMR